MSLIYRLDTKRLVGSDIVSSDGVDGNLTRNSNLFLPELDHVTLGVYAITNLSVLRLLSITYYALVSRLKFSAMFLRHIVP